VTGWLGQAKVEADEAKKEYDIILNEMRDADLKTQYGADQVLYYFIVSWIDFDYLMLFGVRSLWLKRWPRSNGVKLRG